MNNIQLTNMSSNQPTNIINIQFVKNLILENVIEEITFEIKKSMTSERKYWVRPFNRERATKGEYKHAVNFPKFINFLLKC